MIAKCVLWTDDSQRTVSMEVVRYTGKQVVCEHPATGQEFRFRKWDGNQVGEGAWKIVNIVEVLRAEGHDEQGI